MLFKSKATYLDWTVYASHEHAILKKRFHPGWSFYDLFPINRPAHLHFTQNTKIIKNEISIVMNWLAEYGQVSIEEMWQQFPKLKNDYFPEAEVFLENQTGIELQVF